MPLKFFQVPLRDLSTIESELNSFLRSHRVLAVDRRWVDQGQDSFWAICVDYSEGDSATHPETRTKGRAKDYRESLSPEDFAVFVRLRELRKEVAQGEGVPVYAIFTNEQLAKMVESRARATSDLEAIAGVGDARIEKYGARFVETLQLIWKHTDETGGAAV